MKTELIVALIAGAVAFATGVGTIWNSYVSADRSNSNARLIQNAADKNAKAIEQLKQDFERGREEEKRRRDVWRVVEPLTRSAYDLQSRIFNLLEQNLAEIYIAKGTLRERNYVVDNTAFLVSQYLCWTEISRKSIQFSDLTKDKETRELVRIQDDIYSLFSTDDLHPPFRIFAGEQRAIGEALIVSGGDAPDCMGYGAFLISVKQGQNPLIDSIRADVLALGAGVGGATERLKKLQNALIDLLGFLDPDYIRFPKSRRSKV